MSTTLRSFLVCLAALTVSACATRQPVLYPNARMEAAGPVAADAAIAECQSLAEEAVTNSHRADGVAEDTTRGAAVGAAAGAAAGAVRGGFGRGLAVGAAGGGAAGFINGLFRTREPNATFKGYVNRCLRDRGFEVIGWN